MQVTFTIWYCKDDLIGHEKYFSLQKSPITVIDIFIADDKTTA